MADQEEELAVGAVLLTPGFAPFDARVKGEYGYGVYDNVLTALEFERMVSLAGSSGARLARPAGRGGKPDKASRLRPVAQEFWVAFPQEQDGCIGPQDENEEVEQDGDQQTRRPFSQVGG